MTLITITGSDGQEHQIDADKADMYRHGSDGTTLTDSEWDEQQRRLSANHDNLVPEGFLK